MTDENEKKPSDFEHISKIIADALVNLADGAPCALCSKAGHFIRLKFFVKDDPLVIMVCCPKCVGGEKWNAMKAEHEIVVIKP